MDVMVGAASTGSRRLLVVIRVDLVGADDQVRAVERAAYRAITQVRSSFDRRTHQFTARLPFSINAVLAADTLSK